MRIFPSARGYAGAILALAALSFVAIFALDTPFPAIVVAAALIGQIKS